MLHFINGKYTLSHLQDTYAEEMKKYGLRRGTRFIDSPEIPTTRHKSFKEYYKEASQIKTKFLKKKGSKI